MPEVEHVLAVQNELGEGPIWDDRERRLRWVDIERSRLYAFEPLTGRWSYVSTPVPFTALGLRRAGGFVVAGRDGFALWHDESGTYEPLVDPEEHLPDSRFNDGAVDPAGRFWAGTMDTKDPAAAESSLYRLSGGTCDRMLSSVTVANGIDWSPDGRTMYFTDTLRGAIDAFDFDPHTGDVTKRRPFARIDDAEGKPDGLCVDADGCVWSALWGGSRVIRLLPNGERAGEYAVPATQVTSCAFGGAGLDELYITTARSGLGAEELAGQPLAGDLFRLLPGVSGQRPHAYADVRERG
jgi:sugar lactone lactonase YvrE